MKKWMIVLIAITGWSLQAAAAPGEGHSRLYSKTDPADTGGIKGTIVSPSKPIERILAIPPDEPRLVYLGVLNAEDPAQFQFKNLPMRTYDLFVIYDDAFYEGLQLHRDADTLPAAERKLIMERIDKTEPFFTRKQVHRLEGTPGRGNVARAVCTFSREVGSESLMEEMQEGGFKRADWRRTFKIVMLKQVGPGWQVTRTRDLYPVWMDPKTPYPKHHFNQTLSRIRVSDYINDLGKINLLK